MQYSKATAISIKTHPDLNEKWIQRIIAEDPGILGLGDLILKDEERIQVHGGRLDLLLQDAESTDRFEVEIQLGRTDESHIIRTIEYWDEEKRRFPQYEHTAVIVAEDITSRFFNVISLFNGAIPLVAIQMNALEVDDAITLTFTKLLDQRTLGLVEEEEEASEVTDRTYWEKRSSPKMVSAVDELVKMIQSIDESLESKYNKFYIGLAKEGVGKTFVHFRPRKNYLVFVARLSRNEPLENRIEESGLDVSAYDVKRGRYVISNVKPEDISEHKELLVDLFRAACSEAGF